MRRRASLIEAVYRASLRLFPESFREEYGSDLVQLVRDRRAELEGKPGTARAVFWLRAFADVLTQSLAERAWRRSDALLARPHRRKKGGIMIDSLRADLSYALRSIARAPGFTALIVLTFALAIGANTAIFGVLHGILLEPLPFGGPDALVALWESKPSEGLQRSETSAGLLLDWRAKNQTLEDLTAWTLETVVLQGEVESEALNAVLVYPNFFSVLGLDPLFGRRFEAEDAPPVGQAAARTRDSATRGKAVILSHALWRDRFGSDPALVGRTLRIDGDSCTVIGVMRPEVAAPSASVDLWIPVSLQSPIRWERHVRRYGVYGRLREGLTDAQAQQDLSRIAAELRAGEYKDIYERWDARVVPLREEIVGGSRPTLLIAFGAVALVLLIACVNIANMLLARAALVAAQLALATVLLSGAGLLTRTLLELGRVDPGFDTEGSVALRLFLDAKRYDSAKEVALYFTRLRERLAALPSTRAVGATSALPMDPLGINYDLPYRLDGQSELDYNKLPSADFRVVTPGYFEALGVRLAAGRMFAPFDRAGNALVALVNETMARRAWPNGDAIGQRLETPSTEWHWFQVVGIVSDTRYYGLRSDPKPEIYVAHGQVPRSIMTFVVRADEDDDSLAALLRREVLREDPAQPVHSLVAMRDLVADTVARERFYTLVLGAFAALALTLAASGIFGVISYWVAGTTQEIGVRMALGASRAKVTRSVLAKGLGLGGAGAALGLAAALATSRTVESVLFHVSATDGATLGGVAFLLLATALAACAVPAMRASRVDPIVALREE